MCVGLCAYVFMNICEILVIYMVGLFMFGISGVRKDNVIP